MKKLFNVLLSIVIFILFIFVFFSSTTNKILTKDTVSDLVDEYDLEEYSNIIPKKCDNIVRKIIKNYINSYLFGDEIYKNNEILEMLENEVDFDNVYDKTYSYASLVLFKDNLSNVFTFQENTLYIFNIIKNISSYLYTYIIGIVLFSLLLISINIKSFKWMKCLGITAFSSYIFYVIILFFIRYGFNVLNEESFYEIIINKFDLYIKSFSFNYIYIPIIGIILVFINCLFNINKELIINK